MQSGWILVWLLIAYSWDRLSCWSEELSCMQVKQPRCQCDGLNISSRVVRGSTVPRPQMEFDVLMLQINRVSMLYPDGEVTRMLSKIAKSVNYEVYYEKILRIPADCNLKEIRLKSAPRLRTIKVSGTNNVLKTLQLLRSAIRRLPTSLQHLQKLDELYVNDGLLDTFSLDPLNGIHGLTHVFLMKNKLRRLEVSKDPTLDVAIEKLSMSHNRLQLIDMEFFTPLKRLRELEFKSNGLKRIVAKIPVRLPSLNYINLAYNKMKQLDFSNWIAPNLSICILTGNNFTDFPLEIARLSKLVELSVSSNQLTILDLEKLESLPILKDLDASNNRLHTVLPDCQSRKNASCQGVSLAALESLDLRSNQLTTINFNLWDIPSLKRINLQDNQLQRLTNPFNKFANLVYVYIANNLLNCLDIRSLEKYVKNYMISLHSLEDKGPCLTNSSIKHPYENEIIICCND